MSVRNFGWLVCGIDAVLLFVRAGYEAMMMKYLFATHSFGDLFDLLHGDPDLMYSVTMVRAVLSILVACGCIVLTARRFGLLRAEVHPSLVLLARIVLVASAMVLLAETVFPVLRSTYYTAILFEQPLTEHEKWSALSKWIEFLGWSTLPLIACSAALVLTSRSVLRMTRA